MRATLSALALLALATGARAQPAIPDCSHERYLYMKEPYPRMIATANMRSCPNIHRQGECKIPYGGDTAVTILCSSDDARNLTIYKYEESFDLETEQLNSTTIQLTLRGFEEGVHWYWCKDNKSNCENSIGVYVDIIMSVLSSTYYYRVDGIVDNYFVFYQDSYEVFCRAKDSALITINTYFDSQPLPLEKEILNDTTAKVKRRADHIGEELYECDGDNGPWSKRKLNVVVDYHAEARNFRCMFHNMRKLECTWTSSSKRNTFKLFYRSRSRFLRHDAELICADNTGDISGSCSWNNKLFGSTILELIPHRTLNLTLQTCNEFYCSNQTFNFLLTEITRTDVTGLQLVNTSSHGAALTWRAPLQFKDYRMGDQIIQYRILDYMYKIQYRLLSAAWREANTSSVVCDRIWCMFHLELPCPDWRYQVKVYAKIVQAAGERFWSEPASLYVFTDPQNTADAMNPECYAALPEPEPITNAYTAASEIDKLVRETMNAKIVMKKYLRDLRVKVAEVERLRESLAALGAE